MNPLLLKALLGLLGPQLLATIFGGGGPRERLRAQALSLLSPGNIAARANANQAEWYRSPAYGAAQAAALAAGRQAEAGVTRAGAGVTSGMDILQGAAAAGLGSASLSRANADAYMQSRELAQRQAEAAASTTLGVGVSPDLHREMLGASLNFLGPILGDIIRRRYGVVRPNTTQSTQRGWYDPASEGTL